MSIDSSSAVVSVKSKTEEQKGGTFFNTEVKKYSSSSATNWYEGDDISRLLQHLVGDRTDIEIFTPINIEQSDTLHINLWDEQIQQALRISKGAALASTYLFPINLGNRHWAALYLHFPTINRFKPHVSYFDPYGTSTMPAELVQALSAIYTDLKPEDFLACPLQLQQDTYNCGPWIVAIFESLITTGRFPNEGLNIQLKRQEYALILQGKPKIGEGVGGQKEEKKQQKRPLQPLLFTQTITASLEDSIESKKELLSDSPLNKNQLKVLLQEAKNYEQKSGYDSQVKAAFYYNVALIFCEKQLQTFEKFSIEAKEIKRPPLPQTDLIRYFQQQSACILKQLAELEYSYPQKALGVTVQPTLESKIDLSVEHKISSKKATPEVILERLTNNQYKKELEAIRAKVAEDLDLYRKQSTIKKIAEDKKSEVYESKENPKPSMQEIYHDTTMQMKALVTKMIAACIDEYQQLTGQLPPCDYAFIGFGSLASNEVTPYSDLEFGILLADEKKEYKDYFYAITKLLHLKIINLGETTPRIMGVELPTVEVWTGEGVRREEIINPVPNGLSFDGMGAGGCKNPFGRQDKEGQILFELIGKPSTIADYQKEIHYGDESRLKDERFLPTSLAHVGLIVGGKAGQALNMDARESTLSEPLPDSELVEEYLKAPIQH